MLSRTVNPLLAGQQVDRVQELAGQPEPHATAREVVAVGRDEPGEGVVETCPRSVIAQTSRVRSAHTRADTGRLPCRKALAATSLTAR